MNKKMALVTAITSAKMDSLNFETLKLSLVYHKNQYIAIGKIYGVLSGFEIL